MTPAPFVDHEDSPAYLYCSECDAMYRAELGHQCDPTGPLIRSTLALVAILVILAWLVLR